MFKPDVVGRVGLWVFYSINIHALRGKGWHYRMVDGLNTDMTYLKDMSCHGSKQ